MTDRHRGVSAVIGVILMVVITLLFASVISYQLTAFGSGLNEQQQEFDESVSTLAGNPWSGQPGDLVRISNNKAGATNVKYRVNFTIDPDSLVVGNLLDSIYLEVTTGSPDMFSNTDQTDLILVGIDEGSDGSIDRDITSDVDNWNVQDGGTALKIEFLDAYVANADDSIIVTFEGVDNPQSAGYYDLRAQINSLDNWHHGTITIVE